MSPTDVRNDANTDQSSNEAELQKYGIERVPVDYFHYRQFRYTNLNDALAQAKRDKEADKS
jgi:hypothetical protein